MNLSELSLAELSIAFASLMEDSERMKKSKEAEPIKAAFYKKLSKEKAEAGYSPLVDEPKEGAEQEEVEVEVEDASSEDSEKTNPFEIIEKEFKSLYLRFKKERAEYNKKMKQEREENLKLKETVIKNLKIGRAHV